MDLKEPYYRQLNSWWQQQPMAGEAEGVAASGHIQQDPTGTSPASDSFAPQVPLSMATAVPLGQLDPLQQQQQQLQNHGWL